MIFGAGANGTPAWVPVKLKKDKLFIPVYSITFPSKHPLRIAALAGYSKARRKILDSQISLLYVHSPECALPFIFFNRKIPIVFHQHGSGNPVLRAKYKWARSKLTLIGSIFNQIHRLIYRRADWIIAIDRFCLEQAKACGASDKTSLIMNTVDTSQFKPDEPTRAIIRERYRIPDDCHVLLFVGRIEEIKNVYGLIESVKLLRDEGGNYRLYVAGDGTLKKSLEDKVKSLGLEKEVQFLGKVSHEELPGYYNMADVFALPSFMEGTPMVLMEALSCGTPVIATKVGGVPDIVVHCSNGIMIDEGTPEEIAAAVKAAQKLDKDRNRISRSVSHHRSINVAKQLTDIFSTVLTHHESKRTRHSGR